MSRGRLLGTLFGLCLCCALSAAAASLAGAVPGAAAAPGARGAAGQAPGTPLRPAPARARTASDSPPALSARAAMLIEASTGQGLYRYAHAQELPIASATKLMTALITIEHARLSDVFTQNAYYPASVDSQLSPTLRPGERMTVHDLLLALLLPSADDAAEGLAYNVGRGSVGRFIGMMNARARQLGLTRTHYATPSGLDTDGNYSSASDLLKLARYLLAHHPFFRSAVASPSALLRSGDQQRFVVNRNTLIGRVPWVNGVKTGHTSGAGYVLVGSGTRYGMTLISAVLGTPSEGDRNADTLALLDYGFAAFRLTTPIVAGTVLARLPVRDQPGKHAVVIAARSVTQVVPKRAGVRTRLELPRELKGPLRRHAVVGSVVVLVGGQPVARVPLLLARALPGVSTVALVGRFVSKPLSLAVIFLTLLLAAIAVPLTISRRRRRRAQLRRRPRPAPAGWSETETLGPVPVRVGDHVASD